MIIDCFTFFNEYDMLEGRLEYLYDHVDYFVIVEANLSFSGISKPFNYINNITRYRSYADKILYFPIDIPRENYQWTTNVDRVFTDNDAEWQVEYTQRNHIGHALKMFPDEAIALVGDIDEIPNRDSLNQAVNALKNAPAVSLNQKVLVYNLTREQIGTWYGTVAAKCGVVKSVSAQHCRNSRFFEMPHIDNGGWHLTYWGSADQIRTKLENFAHQEKNTPEYTDTNLIQRRIELGLHPLEPIELVHEGFTRSIPITGLPQGLVDVFSKYER